jgi:hypothetical protein
MEALKPILFSLQEACQLLKERLQEYEASLAFMRKESPLRNFNHGQYIRMVLLEMLVQPQAQLQHLGYVDSTRLLVQAGVDPATATHIALEIFKVITDIVAATVPNITYNSGTHKFELVGECDIIIAPLK